ncbi:beta-glucosidase [Ruminiclostridium sufflavum DSM 19573]|uniref:Beta-glucosidase n=1 Tax=Ruminiclostridium sufflavum DSM 19573 TaxID=1121337 RepID=A0A318XIX7_9FIRM|nr:glycoside hydrolase family 3 C-terminal domain-containing protein [Ruminiclostridium sufflavum]PYG85793.1 beta-glucosidase [Ruminiclostridium sufflavum DSM 19573]
MNEKINALISEMTLEEKANILSGKDFWHTEPVKRLGIPEIMVADGPAGLRKQEEVKGALTTVPCTCFPSESLLACSWDTDLMESFGKAMGEEAGFEGVNIVLGPGCNIKRSPVCGRNFEYLSEDPYLSGVMAGHIIKGVQAEGVGTSLKHYIANNQEHRRLSVNAVIDERALREIYLKSFEYAVKIGKPWTVMCSYNRVNSGYVCESRRLLTDILRNEWGFDGIVVSDWGAVNDRVECLKAGLDLEMPSSGMVNTQKIINAVNEAELDIETVDKSVGRLLELIFKAVENKAEKISADIKDINHKRARKIAGECIVLLKNEQNMLPLSKSEDIAFIGMFAKQSRFEGGGSSHVIPTRLESAYDEMCKLLNREIPFAPGYSLNSDIPDEELIKEAIKIASGAQKTVIFAGLPENYESEGYDRKHMDMPASHICLINEICKVNRNVIVVLSNGAPVAMPWIDNAGAVMEGYLWGQAGAGAVCELLLGISNPCGKLAESFPVALEHNPSYLNFPGEDDEVYYRESVFTGYRYYGRKKINPLFCFGHGLSYTSFEYSALRLEAKVFDAGEDILLNFKVKNSGDRQGKEIYQIYIRNAEGELNKQASELKQFGKLELAAGEEKEVTVKIEGSAFSHFCTREQAFIVEEGEFEILIGASSEDIRLTAGVKINSADKVKKVYHKNSTIGDIKENPAGKILFKELEEQYPEAFEMIFNGMEDDGSDFRDKMIHYTVLRSLVYFSKGLISEQKIEELINILNNN